MPFRSICFNKISFDRNLLGLFFCLKSLFLSFFSIHLSFTFSFFCFYTILNCFVFSFFGKSFRLDSLRFDSFSFLLLPQCFSFCLNASEFSIFGFLD